VPPSIRRDHLASRQRHVAGIGCGFDLCSVNQQRREAWLTDARTDDFGTARGTGGTGMVLGPFGQARINDGAGVAASAYETLLSLTTNAGASLGIKADQFFHNI